MAEVDTSSYPKPQLPVSPLDMAGKLGSLQQQNQQIQSGALTIDKQKLDLVNQHMAIANHELSILANDPDLNQNKVTTALNRIAKTTNMPPEVYNKMHEEYAAAGNDAAKLKATVDLNLRRGMSVAEQIQQQYGTPTETTDNANVYNGVVKGATKGGGFVPTTSMPVQLPPAQPNVNTQRILPDGSPNPAYLSKGVVGPSGPPGVRPYQPALPVGQLTPMPAPRPSAAVSGPSGPTVAQGTEFANRYNPVVTEAAPGVADAAGVVKAQSGKDYATDLTRGKTLQSDLYPAHRVLDILKEEGPNAFGVGTDQLNTLKNAIVTWFPGQVDEKTVQSVANVGEAKKQLVQLARSNGNSGTNDQLAAAFEGSPNTKMTGATIESVVKSIVALRKMQAALPLMFAKTGLPEGEYSTWVAKNQNKVDPRAFGFDMMDRAKQDKLLNSFTEKDSDSKEMKAAKAQAYTNFKNSLQFAHDAQMIGN